MPEPNFRSVGSRQGLDDASEIGRLTDVLSGPLGDVAIRNFRVRPRQARSIESVERILSTAARMMFRQRGFDGISIERVANEAGVTPQAAYRYFKDPDELIRTSLRCFVIRQHERIVMLLSGREIPELTGLARAVADIVLEACGSFMNFPDHVRESTLQEYRQVGYDASAKISGLICKDVGASDVRRSLDGVKMSLAYTAITAVATSLFSQRIPPLRESKIEDILAAVFLSVLQSSGSPFEALREPDCEFDRHGAGDVL